MASISFIMANVFSEDLMLGEAIGDKAATAVGVVPGVTAGVVAALDADAMEKDSSSLLQIAGTPRSRSFSATRAD
jgi:hypothetical protein